jgi:hypothetical protein
MLFVRVTSASAPEPEEKGSRGGKAMRSVIRPLACFLALTTLGAAAWAQTAEAPEMSPEEAATMAAFEKAGTPGEPHAWLASTVGSWEFQGTFWTAPGTEPTLSSGTAERTVLLGGRVVREEVTSEMWGQPFGHTGYDNMAAKYWSTWADNMSTTLMVSTGTCENATCTFQATATDPMTGQPATSRWFSTHEADREVHEMYGPGPDGQEFKMMELVYARKP